MGHCMSGSQLPTERNKPHYLCITHKKKHECFLYGSQGKGKKKHALNIHATLLSRFDMSLALIDRKPLGHMLAMNVRNRRKGRNWYLNTVCARLSECRCLCVCADVSHLSSIDREYSSVLRLGGGFAGGGGRRSAQFIVLCLGSLGVRTPFF